MFEDGAFSDSSKLKIAIIPASVTQLPSDAFNGCNRLTIVIPSGSAAEAWAVKNFFPVDTENYDSYVKEYEALYPQHW